MTLPEIFNDIQFDFFNIEEKPSETVEKHLRFPKDNHLPTFQIDGCSSYQKIGWFEVNFGINKLVKTAKDIDWLIYSEILKYAPIVVCNSNNPLAIIGGSLEHMLSQPETDIREQEMAEKGICLYSSDDIDFMPENLYIVAFDKDPKATKLYWRIEDDKVFIYPMILPWNYNHQFETNRIVLVRYVGGW